MWIVQIMVFRAVWLLMSRAVCIGRDAREGSPCPGCLTAPRARGRTPMHIVTGSVPVEYLYLCFMVWEMMQGEGVLCCRAPVVTGAGMGWSPRSLPPGHSGLLCHKRLL